MFWGAREEAMLHELPLPEVDAPGSANEVRWPAGRSADCASVLLGLFDAGLVGVMLTETQQDLPPAEAREVLADYGGWSPMHSLVITDAGEAALD